MKNPKFPQPVQTTTSMSGAEEEKQLLVDMGRVDDARSSQENANPLDQAIAGEPAPAEVADRQPDPLMVSTLTMLVSTGINVLHVKYKWTDPGDEWKKQVATLGALLIDRYLPGILKEQGEIAALGITIGAYVIENVIRQSSASKSDPGIEGERKDDFIKPAPEDLLSRSAHPA